MEGEGSGGVPSEGLEVANGLIALGEEREAAMPEVVKADGGSRPLQERLVVAVDDVLSVEGLAVLGGEDEAVLLPLGARP